MALRNTDYSENLNTNIITLTQDVSDIGNDGRLLYDLNGNTFWITDDFKISKRDNLGAITETAALETDNTNKITMCQNKAQDTIYIIYYKITATTGVYLYDMNVSTMTLGTNTLIEASAVTPLRAIVSKDGEIWWMTAGIIYKIAADGSNLRTAFVGNLQALPKTMYVNTDNICYLPYFENNSSTDQLRIWKFTDSGVSIDQTRYDYTTTAEDNIVDSFILDNTIYLTGSNQMFKVPIAELSNNLNWTRREITTDYGITTTTNFFTDGVAGYFYENNSSDRQKMWKVDLSDLSCISLKIHNLINLEFKFEVSGTEQTIVTPLTSNNCDPSGFLLSGSGATGSV